MKKIVHISGYNLREMKGVPSINRSGALQQVTDGDWHHVCWGDTDKYQLGRIPMGLWAARHFIADTIVWSTGCSRRTSDNKSEARVTYETAYDNYLDLHGNFPHRFSKRTWRTEQAYHSWLTRHSVFEETSSNTIQSMNALRQMIRDDIGKSEHVIVYLVSSANHLPRVLRDAELAFDIGSTTASFMQRVTLCAIPAETNYGKGQIQDLQIDDLGKTLAPIY